jgi:hypothetical protein
MSVNYLAQITDIQNYLSNQGIDTATNANWENNLKMYRNYAYDRINKYLDYDVCSTTYTDEVYFGNDTHYLYLNNRPVTTLTSVKWDNVSQTVGNFTLIDSTYLYYEDGYFTKGDGLWKVTYVAGYTYATMPGNIRMACLLLCALKQSEAGGVSTMLGKSSISDGRGSSITADPEAEQRILDTIASYRRMVI